MARPKPDNQTPALHPAWVGFWQIVAEEAARLRQLDRLRAVGTGDAAEDAEECPEMDAPPMPGKHRGQVTD